MDTVAMILRGKISSCTDKSYLNNSRPNAKAAEGFAICEISLADENSVVSSVPQKADLCFMRVVKFEDGTNEIDLYDGPKIAMKFWPASLSKS